MTPSGRDSARPTKTGRPEWEEEYRSGRWRYLGGDEEVERYQAIASRIPDTARVLDLGCGESILYGALGGPARPGGYLGVDWSLTALRTGPWGPGHSVVCGDVSDPPIRGRFDSIVLSEVIYYLDQPLNVLDRLCSHLNDDGQMLVSLFRPRAKTQPLWAQYIDGLIDDLLERFRSARLVDVVQNSRRMWSLYSLAQADPEPDRPTIEGAPHGAVARVHAQ